MALLVAIAVGIVVGVLAGYAFQGTFSSMTVNMALGLIGAIIGDAIYFFSVSDVGERPLISVVGLLCQIFGALILVAIFSLIRKTTPRSVKKRAAAEHVHQEE